ncbi:MAG: hypothetical protein ACI4VX_05140 [Succinivibrionaceae bacterium]
METNNDSSQVFWISSVDDKGENVASSSSKNILLLSLSTFVKQDLSYNTFSFQNEFFDEKYIYQLEPVPLMLIKKLAQKNEKLDEIILLCTKDVLRKVSKNLNGMVVKIRRDESEDVSPFEFFKHRVKESSSKYGYTPVFKKIEIGTSDNNPDKEDDKDQNIRHAIKDILQELRSNMKPVTKLHMDIHGGFRDQQDILTTVVSLLRYDEVNAGNSCFLSPENVYTVEFNDGKGVIRQSGDTLRIQSFASGINEVINYARTGSLSSYREGLNKEEQDLLDAMNDLAESIQLMNIQEFEKNADKLKTILNSLEGRSSSSYISMFLENIKSSYQDLIKDGRTVVDEIEWCMNKGFYQQALTLIESKMPIYYHNKKMMIFSEQCLDFLNRNSNIKQMKGTYTRKNLSDLGMRDIILLDLFNNFIPKMIFKKVNKVIIKMVNNSSQKDIQNSNKRKLETYSKFIDLPDHKKIISNNTLTYFFKDADKNINVEFYLSIAYTCP